MIWEIVAAAPVRDFWIRKRVMNDIDITNVLIEPRRIRNCSLFNFPIISEPMIAAWLLPSPGKNEQKGEMIAVEIEGLISSLFVRASFWIFCSGILVFVRIEFIIVDAPKSPVKRGRRGCWMFKLNEASPRNPARRKMIVALIFDFFSWRIRNIAIQIRKSPSILSMNG